MDREKLIDLLENEAIATNTGYVEVPLFLFSEIIALLKEQPEIVRCKDCKHYKWLIESCDHVGGSVAPDWFCADGMRR